MDVSYEADTAPVYVISVAATLAGMHPQTLRTYDRLGLVSPGRTAGRGRRYSRADIARLRQVQRLSQDEGINLEGIRRILDLQEQLVAVREELDRLRAQLDEVRAHAEQAVTAAVEEAHASYRRDLVPVTRGTVVLWRH